MSGQHSHASEQQMVQTPAGYTISAPGMDFGHNSDVNTLVSGNIRDRAAGLIVGTCDKMYDFTAEAIDTVRSALALDQSASPPPTDLLTAVSTWVFEKLKRIGEGAVDGLCGKIPVGTMLGGMVTLHQQLQQAQAQAEHAQDIETFCLFLGRLERMVFEAQTALHTGAGPWLDTLQGHANTHPEDAQLIYDALREWGDRLMVALSTTQSMPAQLASLIGQWVHSQDGHVELRLVGTDFTVQGIHLHCAHGNPLADSLYNAGSNLKDTGLDVRVRWYPEPALPMAHIEGCVPTNGDPYIAHISSNLFSAADRQRFAEHLHNPALLIP